MSESLNTLLLLHEDVLSCGLLLVGLLLLHLLLHHVRLGLSHTVGLDLCVLLLLAHIHLMLSRLFVSLLSAGRVLTVLLRVVLYWHTNLLRSIAF